MSNPVLRMLRDSITDLEASARELDPGKQYQDELWAAVGAHVLGNVSTRGEAPAYAPDGIEAANLDLAAGASRDEVASFFAQRRDRHDALTLNLLCDRIGGLGPEPRCLAVWTVPGWDALVDVVRDLDGVDAPVRLVHGALYRDLGAETL